MAGMTNSFANVNEYRNSTIYTTLFPCTNCSKLIAALGVKKVVYLNARTDVDDYISSCILLNKAGVECIDFRELTNSDNIEFDLSENEKNNIKIRKRSLSQKQNTNLS